jgi:hypothetical protein
MKCSYCGWNGEPSTISPCGELERCPSCGEDTHTNKHICLGHNCPLDKDCNCIIKKKMEAI